MPERLAPDAFRAATKDGVLVIDLRPLVAFARGHVPGAVSIPFAGESFLPQVVDVRQGGDVALVDDVPLLTEGALAQLAANSFRVAAVLDGGSRAWERAGLPLEALPEVTPEEAASRLADFTIIDVREPWEKALGDIPGARAIPFSELPAAVASLSPGATYLMACRSGVKSVHAQAYLQRHGRRAVNLAGGFTLWEMSGLPLE